MKGRNTVFYSPAGDFLQNVLAFVNLAVVHNNDRVFTRVRIHAIEKTNDEFFERIGTEGAFTNITK